MSASDSKRAEKEYLARSGADGWERHKPFSHPGADTLAESAGLLHAFAVAMLALDPRPDDLILDLGAGGGWCSDLLSRLNRRSIAVDISVDMLRAARSRPNGTAVVAVAGDMERLPFGDGAFDKAVCFNALHHVPDMSRAVGEVARVLHSSGVAFFSEPGRGHSRRPEARSAMQDFGVLEQDVPVPALIEMCRAAGFADVRLKPMSYAVPAFDLTLEDWESWSKLARSRRPARALQKMTHAVAELLGIGKQDALFEEAFAIRLVRLLRGVMEDHPIVVARRSRAADDAGAAYRAEITVVQLPTSITLGERVVARIVAKNSGTASWRRSGVTIGHVMLGVQLLDDEGRLIARDYARASLAADVPPGGEVTIVADIPSPSSRGRYRLKFDFVAEGVTWFEQRGSTTAVLPLGVD